MGVNIVVPNSIDKDRLEVEFVLCGNLTESKIFNAVNDVTAYISKKQPPTRLWFAKTKKLAELVLSLPVFEPSAERLFSVLKRLKTCVQTITEKVLLVGL